VRESKISKILIDSSVPANRPDSLTALLPLPLNLSSGSDQLLANMILA